MQEPGRRTGRFARHLSYANVVSTLALLFAMTGGALAASHYVITSTKQIKPTVLKKLTPKAAPAYSAGSGLVLAGHQFSLNPSVIPTIPTIPAAYPGGGCASGSLLQSLSASGGADCATDHAYSASSGSQPLAGPQSSVVHVPAGNWVVMASAQGGYDGTGSMTCSIYSGSTLLNQQVGTTSAVGSGSPYADAALVAATTTTDTSTNLEIYCTASPSIQMQYLNVVAIPVAALN
jgi:hypothetical protein